MVLERKARIRIVTQGCSANVADSESMAGVLQEAGFELCETAPDLVVFNTCTVKGPTESAFRRELDQLEQEGTAVVVAGCIPQADPKLQVLTKHSSIGTSEIARIAEVAARTLNGEKVHLLRRKKRSPQSLSLPVVPTQPSVAIIPISQGCLSACSFCKTKHARGHLQSIPPNEIVRAISARVKSGAEEVWLTSQDNSAYGFDCDIDLAQLLESIVAIPRDFRVRVGMANPDHFSGFWEHFLDVFGHEKIFRFIHIPVQAGSDSVLQDMKREYQVRDFEKQVEDIRARYPEVTIGTDLICGFPTETVADFERTLELVERTRPDIINISRFWPRPGTPAAKLKPLQGSEVKRRSRALTELFQEIARKNNEKWLGWKGEGVFRETGKDGSILGRNFAYKQLVLKNSMGQNDSPRSYRATVEVTSCGPFDLKVKELSAKVKTELFSQSPPGQS